MLVVAPEYANHIDKEADVVRIPAIQNFNGSDFSVPVPIPGFLNGVIRDFQPQIVHTHHPFSLWISTVPRGVEVQSFEAAESVAARFSIFYVFFFCVVTWVAAPCVTHS